MKKTVFALMLVFLGTSMWAQPDDHQKKKEKMDAMRIGFITDALQLTSEEAQVFWPVFNEMNDKLFALRSEEHKAMMKQKDKGKTIDDMSDKELNDMMLKHIANEKEMATIKESYHQKFLDVIGVKKTAKLYKSDHDFKRELLRKSKGGKGKGHDGPPPHK